MLASKPPQPPTDSNEPPTETFAQKLRISEVKSTPSAGPPSEPWPEKSQFPPPFPQFHKFARRLAQNPEQVLRYEYGGQPLLYSGTDTVATRFIVPHNKVGAVQGMPRCESCGAGRVFELQLVPGLIEALEEGEEVGFEEGMEWGTIILGICGRNCAVVGEVVFREEWVGVQWEERVKYKK